MKVGIRVMLAAAMLTAVAFAPISAIGAGAAGSPWTIDKTLVGNAPGDETVYDYLSADFSEYRLAYETSTVAEGSQIHVYDLRLDTTSTVVDGLDQKSCPQILGTSMLFAGEDGDDWGVWSHELGDDASSLVTTTPQPADINLDNGSGNFAFAGDRPSASVDETIAVADIDPTTRIWAGCMNEPADIARVNSDDAVQIMPRVVEDEVAYFEYQETLEGNDYFQLIVQSLADPSEREVIEDYIMPGSLAAQGDLIAWTQWDEDAEQFILKAYNASDDEYSTPIPVIEGNASNPCISGTQIYWATSDELYATNAWDTVLERSVLGPVGTKLVPLAVDDNCFAWATNTGDTTSRFGVSYLDVPFVWMECTPQVKYNEMPFAYGQVVDNNFEVGGGRVLLQSSDDGQLWTTVNDGVTDANGYFQFSAPKLTTNKYYRVVYAGKLSTFNGEDAFNLSALSTVRWCVAQASVGAPSAPKTIKYNKTFTSSGNINPSQTDQQAAGRIEAYYLQGSKWVRKATFGARFSGTRYSASVKLSKKGKWMLRMNFLGSNQNAPAKSGWTKVTAN